MILLTAIAAFVLGQPISLESLLKEMVNRDSLARFPDPPYTCSQSSSYDRASKSPTENWFANGDSDQFIRSETNSGRQEWVMHESRGPGAVVRIWSANPAGTLRIYLDNSPTPAVEGPMSDVLGGKWRAPASLSYEASKGWNLYLPIPYAKHCKITSDARGFYYQVNYRTYPEGAAVETLSTAAIDSAASVLTTTSQALTVDRTRGFPAFTLEERGIVQGKTTPSRESVKLVLPAGRQALTGMMVSLKAEDLAQATRSCIIRAEFDGEETIWCPVGDFFGSGVGLNNYQDFYRSVGEDGWMRCRWTMPYERSGTITIENLGKETVQIDIRARVKPWQWDDRSMHFHGAWLHQYPVHAVGGRGTADFNYADITGRGVYVGDTLSILNPVKEWWGEGDEKIYVDGEAFPSHFGTGTEDYYGYAWCSPDTFTRPFHAQPRCDGQERGNNWGRTTVTRSRGLDAIPFSKSLSMNMEVWHWRESDVEYAATSYFYALPGATTNRKPQPEAAAAKLQPAPPLAPPVMVAGAIECETLEVTSKSEGTVVVPQGGFAEVWSKNHHLWVQAKRIGDFVEIKLPATGRSRVTLYATKSWDYGIVRLTINGQRAGEDLDLCSGVREVKGTGAIELGVFEPVDGVLTLRAEVVGSSPQSVPPATFFGLDCVVIGPALP
jgi:hypothetical protein